MNEFLSIMVVMIALAVVFTLGEAAGQRFSSPTDSVCKVYAGDSMKKMKHCKGNNSNKLILELLKEKNDENSND